MCSSDLRMNTYNQAPEMPDQMIQVMICRPDVQLPAYVHAFDAGMDVRAAETILLRPGETAAVPTGLKFALPPGWEIQVRPRSGLSLKTPIRLPNAPGTIDAGFRDELCVLIQNISCPCQVTEPDRIYVLDGSRNQKGTYRIQKGDRIAQLVFARVASVRRRQIGRASCRERV